MNRSGGFNVAGSIRKRPDRGADTWQLRVYVGRDSNGRVRHRSHTFQGSKRAAEKELARLVLEQDAAPQVVPDEASRPWGPTTTINDAISGWKANGWDDLIPVTSRRYESIWKLHIKDGIGKRRIASLSPYDVEKYFRKLKNDGAGRETVRYVRSVLHRACRLARKWSGNQLHNPVTDTELLSWGLDDLPKPVPAPSTEEVLALIEAAAGQDRRYSVALRVVAATGMRRGEACALRWSDIDWDEAIVTIDESVIPADGGAVMKSPKTRASIRQVAVDPGTIDALRILQVEQEALAALAEVAVPEDGFAFRQTQTVRSRRTPILSAGPSTRHGSLRSSLPTSICTRSGTSRRHRSTPLSRSARSRPGWVGRPSIWRATTPTPCPRKIVGRPCTLGISWTGRRSKCRLRVDESGIPWER